MHVSERTWRRLKGALDEFRNDPELPRVRREG